MKRFPTTPRPSAVATVLDRCGWTPQQLKELQSQARTAAKKLAAFYELVRRQEAKDAE